MTQEAYLTSTSRAIDPTTAVTLGERVRAARRELGLSQSQLAGTELTKGFISQIESGLVRPSVRSLQVIANRLGKSLDYFLGDEPLASGKRREFHQLGALAALEARDLPSARASIAAALAESPTGSERAKLYAIRARISIADHQLEQAFDDVANGLAGLDPERDAETVTDLLCRRGQAYFELGHLGAAAEAFEAARDLIERHELTDPRLRAQLLVALGTTYRRLNRSSKAIATYEAALALASRSSLLELVARSFMGVAVTMYDSGEYDGAISNYRRALEIWQKLADVSFELSTMHSLAAVYFDAGDRERARETAKLCLDRARSADDSRNAAVASVELARIALSDGDARGSLDLATEAERSLRGLGDAYQDAWALRAMGEAADAMSDHDASDVAYRQAIDLASSVDHLAARSAIAAEYAQKLRARGEIDQAFEMLDLARGVSAKR